MINYDAYVTTTWHYINKEHYVNRGYQFTKFRDVLRVKVADLSLSSNIPVPVNCDYCGVGYDLKFSDANRNIKQVCKDCHGLNQKVNLGYSYKEIKTTVFKKGFTLLTTEEAFTNNLKTISSMELKLSMLCPQLHPIETTFNNWLHGLDTEIGYRCAKCNHLSQPLLEEIRMHFKNEGYELVSTEYKNSYTHLEFICPNETPNHITWNSWKNGCRCSCIKCTGRHFKYNIETIKAIIEPHGRKVLSTHYSAIGNRSGMVDVLCPKHGKYRNRLDTILSRLEGSMGCADCGREIGLQKSKHKNHVSSPQLYLNYLLGGNGDTIEKFIDTHRLDIIIPDTFMPNRTIRKIYLEYDGGGHFRANHRKVNPLSYQEIVDNDNLKRNNYFKNGWKGIIIRSLNDKLPPEEVITQLVKESILILENTKSDFVTIDLDKGILLHGGSLISKINSAGNPEYIGRYKRSTEIGSLVKVDKNFTQKLYNDWFNNLPKTL